MHAEEKHGIAVGPTAGYLHEEGALALAGERHRYRHNQEERKPRFLSYFFTAEKHFFG
jgi:hypothetical protein